MTRRFEDKTVLITGAAGGIGRATVRAFAAEGFGRNSAEFLLIPESLSLGFTVIPQVIHSRL